MSASPFPTNPSQPGTTYSASTQYGYPASQIRVDQQMEQEELENHNLLRPQDIYRHSVPSAPPVSSSTMIASPSPSLSADSYTQPAWKDDYSDLTSFPCGRVESTTENLVAMPGQIATTREAALARERKVQRKKDLDKARKKTERSQDKQAYRRICQLLNIDLDPINTLANRSEFLCLCTHPRWRY